MSSDPPTAAAASSHPALLAILFAVLALIAGYVVLFVYAIFTQPVLEHCTGGASASVPTGRIIGLVLVGGGMFLAIRTGRLVRILGAFVLCYAGALIVLWLLSPVFWGPRTCTDVGLF